jgi:hypothetical protein
MKGLPRHDSQLQRDYLDKHPKEILLIVLWPSNEGKATGRNPTALNRISTSSITLEEIRSELALPNGRRVVLLAVDGTWRNARRMVARLPPSVPRLDLSSNVTTTIFSSSSPPTVSSFSLLAPLRSKGPSQRRNGGDNLVCTAEAVSLVLMELGMDINDTESILGIARTKVDLVRRYRGHESKIK